MSQVFRRPTGQPFFRHPAQVIVTAFAAAVVVGTVLLMLPVARSGPGTAPLLTALFTSTSAVCVTGLITVDTPTYWSGFGEGVILALIQVGGFGIMTLASLVALLLSRRMGLRSRMTAAAETKSLGLGDVRSILVGVARVSLLFEALTAVLEAAKRRWWRASRPPAKSIRRSAAKLPRPTPRSRTNPPA